MSNWHRALRYALRRFLRDAGTVLLVVTVLGIGFLLFYDDPIGYVPPLIGPIWQRVMIGLGIFGVAYGLVAMADALAVWIVQRRGKAL